jgi:hypothetical protein
LHTIQVLELVAQLLTHVTQTDAPRAPASDSASQAEYATYLRELQAVTAQMDNLIDAGMWGMVR